MRFPELKLGRGSERTKAPLRTKATFWETRWESPSDRDHHKGREGSTNRNGLRAKSDPTLWAMGLLEGEKWTGAGMVL